MFWHQEFAMVFLRIKVLIDLRKPIVPGFLLPGQDKEEWIPLV